MAANREAVRKKFAKELKRREKNPRPFQLPPSKSHHKLLRDVPRDFPNVLLSIELALVDFAKNNLIADDELFDDALRAVALHRAPEYDEAKPLVEVLTLVRQGHGEVSSHDWGRCIQTVRDSIKRHSTMRGGDCSYLNFLIMQGL